MPVTFQINPPDLAPVLFQAPGVVTGPLSYNHHAITASRTRGPATRFCRVQLCLVYQLYVSTHSVLDGSEIQVAPYGSPIESGPVASRAAIGAPGLSRCP